MTPYFFLIYQYFVEILRNDWLASELTVLTGASWSNGRAFSFVPLANVALGRFPFVGSESGQLLVQTNAAKLGGLVLSVAARLPCVPGKTWRWTDVMGGTSLTLPLGLHDLPTKVHNDMEVNISLPDGRTIVHWRRFMRVPAPSHTVEPVQLDRTRAALLVAGQPWLGRGFYMQPACDANVCTAANGVNISVSWNR